MLQLLNALQTAFNGNSSLMAIFTNGLENAQGADLETLPNCILVDVSGTSSYSTRNSNGIAVTEKCFLQFTIRSKSGTQVQQALAYINTLLDHQPLSLATGYMLLDCRQVDRNKVVEEDERVFRGDAEYCFTVGRVIP